MGEEKMSYHYPRHNLMSDSNIFIAAKLGDCDLLRDLLAAGHKVNHKDKYGKAAIHHAVEGVHLDCVKILLDANCRLDYRDNLNRLPIDVADEIDKKLDGPRKV